MEWLANDGKNENNARRRSCGKMPTRMPTWRRQDRTLSCLRRIVEGPHATHTSRTWSAALQTHDRLQALGLERVGGGRDCRTCSWLLRSNANGSHARSYGTGAKIATTIKLHLAEGLRGTKGRTILMQHLRDDARKDRQVVGDVCQWCLADVVRCRCRR